MNKIIKLKDNQELILKLANERYNKRILSDYPPRFNFNHVLESLEQYTKKNMRYNTKTGKIYEGSDCISEYSYKKDIPIYEENIEYLESILWDFLNFIFSGANRLAMGYKF